MASTIDTLMTLDICGDAKIWLSEFKRPQSMRSIWAKCHRADWMIWLLERMLDEPGWPEHDDLYRIAISMQTIVRRSIVKPLETDDQILLDDLLGGDLLAHAELKRLDAAIGIDARNALEHECLPGSGDLWLICDFYHPGTTERPRPYALPDAQEINIAQVAELHKLFTPPARLRAP